MRFFTNLFFDHPQVVMVLGLISVLVLFFNPPWAIFIICIICIIIGLAAAGLMACRWLDRSIEDDYM